MFCWLKWEVHSVSSRVKHFQQLSLSKLDVIRSGLSLTEITTFVAFEMEDTIFLYVYYQNIKH